MLQVNFSSFLLGYLIYLFIFFFEVSDLTEIPPLSCIYQLSFTSKVHLEGRPGADSELKTMSWSLL